MPSSSAWGNILYRAGLIQEIKADAPTANRAQVIQCLAQKNLIAYKVRHQQSPRAKSSAGAATVATGSSVRPVPLAPASPPKAEAAKTLPKPALTLQEAEARLLKARPAVLAAKKANQPLPQSPFTLEDKKAIVKNGLDETVTVRVIESKYANDDGWIGRPTVAGHSYSFSAPLSLVEHGDTDAEALLNAFGTRYDPKKEYTILLMDLNKLDEVGDVMPIIPTYENLYRLIEENPQLTRADLDTVKATLNDDFAPKYEAFAKALEGSSIDQKRQDQLIEFALGNGYSEDEVEAMADRHFIAQDISTWEIFTGNGMTRDMNLTNKEAYGPVEVFAFDKKPMTLGELEGKKAIKRLSKSAT